jgi:hypothetical protein
MFTLGLCAEGGPPPAARRGENILQRLERHEHWRVAALREYQVHRKYLVESPRFGQRASMEVRVNYHYPDGKNVHVLWADGSEWLQTRVIGRVLDAEKEAASGDMAARTSFTPENYDMRVTGVENVEGRPSFVVEITPRERRKFLVKGRIWVDAEDAAVVKLEGEPATGCSFWVHHVRIEQSYTKVGPFWLVASVRTNADVRVYGPAHLDIDYYDYRINNPPIERASRTTVR